MTKVTFWGRKMGPELARCKGMKWFGFMATLGLLACALEPQRTPEGPSDLGGSQSEILSPANYFAGSPPSRFCGPAGFEFLHAEYFEPRCGGSCHVSGTTIPGAAPAFADPDPAVAYSQMLFVSHERLLETVTHNGFCGDPLNPELDCNLSPKGEVLPAILAWSQQRQDCP